VSKQLIRTFFCSSSLSLPLTEYASSLDTLLDRRLRFRSGLTESRRLRRECFFFSSRLRASSVSARDAPVSLVRVDPIYCDESQKSNLRPIQQCLSAYFAWNHPFYHPLAAFELPNVPNYAVSLLNVH
jgi:hypothetical protein